MTQTSKVIELAQLCLRFGRVDRATTHEDGQRHETDTDHTVMLGVIACAFASSCGLDLDIGKVAQFALVHDLVEAYAGDTNTLLSRTGSGEDASKTVREAEAFDKINKDFAEAMPWLPKTIAAYEQLDTREARYVKTLDKVLPKITHILNRGAMLARHSVDANNIDAVNGSQVLKMLASYARDQHEVMLLYADVHAELKRLLVDQARGNGVCDCATEGTVVGRQPVLTIRVGHILASTPTGDVGSDSGRPRFKVECLTCKEILHENTTGPSERIERHIRAIRTK